MAKRLSFYGSPLPGVRGSYYQSVKRYAVAESSRKPGSPGGYDIPLVGLCAFLALIPAWINYDVISNDGAFQYIPMARAFLEGSFRESLLYNPQLPLFPLIVAGISKAFGMGLELSGRAASYLGYVLAAMGAYAVGFQLFRDRRVSFLASLFTMANPYLMNCSVDCLKESLLLCAIMWGNFLVVRGMSAKGAKWPLYLGGGACFALGALLRSTALVFLCSWLIVWAFREYRGRYARAALTLAPVAGFFFSWSFFPGLALFRKSCYHPGYFFASLHGLTDLFRSVGDVSLTFFTAGGPGVMLFALYGLHRRGRDPYACHVLLTAGISFLILVFWIYASHRYYLAPVAWAYPLAAFGVVEGYRAGNRAVKAVSILAVLSTLALWAHASFTPPDSDKVAWREAGSWIQEVIGPGREIISNRERLVYYAQGRRLPFSAFQEAHPLGRVLAIDPLDPEGHAIDVKMLSLGYRPVKRFGRISVYLPHGLRY